VAYKIAKIRKTRIARLLHNTGKIGISTEILEKKRMNLDEIMYTPE